MAALKYRDEHNRIGFLEKPKGSTDYHQVIDFLLDSHIRYAIVTDPLIYDSLITQFWSTASLRSSELGPPAIVATIDGTPYTIIESLVRSYPTEGKLTFHKNKFSPQWRFLIHTLLHCLSTKSGSWDQFGSPLAIALICLCEGKKYNWSRYIFTGMVNNINNSKKFLMFPRFLQMILDIETRNTKPYHAFRLTSKMFANMRLNFHGDHMPLVAAMLPPPQAAIAAGTSGEAAPPNPQTDHETVTEPVHQTASPHDHGSTSPRPTPTTPAAQLNKPVSKPPRPIPTSPSAQVNQQGPSSDPHVESSSKDNDSNPDPNVADDPLGGSFFASPSRSTAAPPEGTTSGGAEDLLTLTALYTLVSEQGKKIGSLESELQAHKLLFKDVMGKLVKRVKFLESKLKARGRNVILSESDKEEDEEQDVDSLIKLAKAAAIAADTSSVPADATQATEFPPSSSIHTDDFVHGNDVPTGTASDFSPDPSNKGKSPMVEEDPPLKERSFRQMEEDRLGAEAARKLYEEEQAELARVQEEMKKKRQEDVINSAKYYNDADWSDIMGQVHANKGLTADLLGPDVNEDNFAARMAAIIAERRRKFAAQRFQDKRNKPMTYAQQRDYMRTFVKNQSSTIYTTGWTMKHVRSFSDDQLKDEFDKIRHAVANLQSQHLRRSLKRQGADLEQPDSKKSKSTEPQKTSVPAASRPSSAGVTPDVHQSPFVDTPPATPPHSPKASSHPDVTPDTSKQPSVAPKPPSGFSATPTVTRTSGPRTRNQSSAAGIKTYSTRRKSLGSRKMSSSEVDLIAADSQPPSVEVPSQKASQEDVEVPSTTTSTAQQTTSSTKKVGTRRKQFSRKGVHPSRSTIPIKDEDPDAEHKMYIRYASDTYSDSDDDTPINLHGVVDWELLPTGLGWVNDTEATGVGLVLWGDLKVLIDSPEVNDGSDTVSGIVLHMFVDKRYPLSVNVIERMLEHQLEICRDTVGNELTTAVQLIAFLKKQISDSRHPKVHDCCGDPVAVHLSMLSFLLLLQSSEVCFWRRFQDVAVQSSGAFNERSI
ncbi:hypothetical protein Tco_0499022 [Tanacetum coccineum]